MSANPDENRKDGAPRQESAVQKTTEYVFRVPPTRAGWQGNPTIESANADALADFLWRLQQWLPNGKKQGQEWCVGSLSGEAGDSLKIHIQKGLWKDFASGEGGSDPVSLYAALHNLKMLDAAKAILGTTRAVSAPPPAIMEDDWRPQRIDDHTPTDPMTAKASAVYRYLNKSGEPVGYILRFDEPSGKSFRPRIWCQSQEDGSKEWRSKGIPTPRPLYGLMRLVAEPNAQVIIVEGEKCVDALQAALPEAVVISWAGGANGIRQADLLPLQGRQLVAWPDNDDPGKQAMALIPGARVLEIPADKPKGWDCADAIAEGWTAERLQEFIGTSPAVPLVVVASLENPEESKEFSSIYYMKHGGKFLWRQPTGQTVFANEDTVKRVYQNEINGGAGKPELGRFLYAIQTGQALDYAIQTGQALDYAGSMPGYHEGIHRENGQVFYCMEAPVLPKSVAPEGAAFGENWPVILELMRRLFVNADGERQFLTVFAHLKMGHQVLRRTLEPLKPGSRRSVQPGQAMALIGPKNCGKSFFLEQVITPLLGGRKLDAFKAFTADAEGFNGEMLKGEVWMIDDQEHSTDIRTRRKFAANLKSKLFGAGMAFHAKYSTPITLTPFGRLFICCNDTPENLSVLPPITEDISDKVHMILCNKTEMPMPTGTESEREAFRDTIAREIPHFAGELEAWTIPEAIAHQRTGVLTYFHPWVEAQLRKQAPEAQLVELILSAFDDGTLHGIEWEGTARELKDQLTADAAKCKRDARSLLSNWIAATGTYLSRLVANRADYEKDYGLRVTSQGQRKGVERYGLVKLSS